MVASTGRVAGWLQSIGDELRLTPLGRFERDGRMALDAQTGGPERLCLRLFGVGKEMLPLQPTWCGAPGSGNTGVAGRSHVGWCQLRQRLHAGTGTYLFKTYSHRMFLVLRLQCIWVE